MSFGRRVLAFPLVRIVLAAAPIVAWLVVAKLLRLPMIVAALVVPALYAGYVRLVERRPVDELGSRVSASALLDRADLRLLNAKRSGRNQVCSTDI